MTDIAIRVETLSKQYPSTTLGQPFGTAQDKAQGSAQDRPHRRPFDGLRTGLRTGVGPKPEIKRNIYDNPRKGAIT